MDGMMNSAKYIDILRRRIVPLIQNPTNDGQEIFQHDLAPCHTSKSVRKFASDNNLTILDWPGNSPDMNPIENLWGIVKKRVAKMDCSTKQKVITNVIHV